VVFATSLLGSVGVFFLSGPLLRFVYGEKFLGSIAPLRILLLGIVVFSVQKVLANYFIGQGRAKWFLRATLLSMAVNVGLNLWLIPLPGWGIKGAALASTISYTLSTLILGVLFVRWSGISWVDILIPNRQDVAYVGARLGRLRTRAAGMRHRGATR
jgi:O-antigen/teichoic acid export membrane protein